MCIRDSRIALDSLAIRLWLPEAKDEEIHLLRSYVEALKTAKTTSEAAEFAFRFQHELAFLSGNTLIPLIFTSFKVPVISLWERFCRMYGIEQLYANSCLLYTSCAACSTNLSRKYNSGSRNVIGNNIKKSPVT